MNDHIEVDEGENFVDITVKDKKVVSVDVDDANGVTIHVNEIDRNDWARFSWHMSRFFEEDEDDDSR